MTVTRATKPQDASQRPRVKYTLDDLRNSGLGTVSVEQAGQVCGIGRCLMYELIRNESFPHLHLGAKIRIPVPALLRLLNGEEGK